MRISVGDDVRNTEGWQDRIELEAAEWVVRSGSSEFSEEDRLCMQAWRDQSPVHETAFQFACRTWADMRETRGVPGSESRPRADGTPTAVSPRPAASRRRIWLSAAASLLVAILAGVWYESSALSPRPVFHLTERGEIRTISLADGSVVHLNTASRIALRYGGRERRIDLLEGEAVFTVASDGDAGRGGRPFVVSAGGGRIRALGTEFAVRRRPDAVEVIVLEHSVEVSVQAAGGDPASIVISSGEAVSYAPGTGLREIVQADLSQVAPWRSGLLIFDRLPLEQVIEEINRYRDGRVVLGNAALARREVSGVFRIAELDSAITIIAQRMNARITSVSDTVKTLH